MYATCARHLCGLTSNSQHGLPDKLLRAVRHLHRKSFLHPSLGATNESEKSRSSQLLPCLHFRNTAPTDVLDPHCTETYYHGAVWARHIPAAVRVLRLWVGSRRSTGAVVQALADVNQDAIFSSLFAADLQKFVAA